MSNEITLIEEKNALEVFTSKEGLDPIIDKIREQVEGEILDPSTDEGRAAIGSLARKIGSSKQQLKKMGQALTEDWRKKTKSVTSETSRMEKELDTMRDKVLAPRVVYEEKKEARKKVFEDRLSELSGQYACSALDDINRIKECIEHTNALYKYEWEEFQSRADSKFNEIMPSLKKALKKREVYDAEQAELKRLQEEDRKRKEKIERDRIAKEAADKATKEAEDKAAKEIADAEAKTKAAEDAKIAAEKKAKQDKINAEAKVKQDKKNAKDKADKDKADAIAAEKKRASDEKAAQDAKEAEQKRIDDARAEDKKHRGVINREALQDLQKAIDKGKNGEDPMRDIVIAIASGKIRHVSIKY